MPKSNTCSFVHYLMLTVVARWMSCVWCSSWVLSSFCRSLSIRNAWAASKSNSWFDSLSKRDCVRSILFFTKHKIYEHRYSGMFFWFGMRKKSQVNKLDVGFSVWAMNRILYSIQWIHLNTVFFLHVDYFNITTQFTQLRIFLHRFLILFVSFFEFVH